MKMTVSGIPGFSCDLTSFDNNNYCGGDFGFNDLGYPDPSNLAGPSQPCTEADVWGDLNNYPDFPFPFAAPTSLDPANGAYLNGGYPFYQGTSVPSVSPQPETIPFPTCPPLVPTPPVPTNSFCTLPFSTDRYAAPTTPSPSYARSHMPGPDDPPLGFPAGEESFSLPAALSTQVYNLFCEQPWHQNQFPGFDPFDLDISPFAGIRGATPLEVPPPPPVASSSGPQRTRQSAREGRKYDPVKPVKNPTLQKNGWNHTLARFRARLDAEFDTLQNVRGGQSSGGLVPEKALAKIDKVVKDDLKRSPLRDFMAGEGKRSRNADRYLEGLLQAILPVEPTSAPGGAGPNENDTTVAALSSLADELERRLMAVNPQPALRQSRSAPGAGTKTSGKQSERWVKRNKGERERRERERHQLERISRLFKVASQSKLWSRKGVLSLAVVFLLYGPTAFPQDFIEVHPGTLTM